MHPPAGALQACWSPNTTPVIIAIPDVIVKPVQSDWQNTDDFRAKFQDYRPTFGTHLG